MWMHPATGFVKVDATYPSLGHSHADRLTLAQGWLLVLNNVEKTDTQPVLTCMRTWFDFDHEP